VPTLVGLAAPIPPASIASEKEESMKPIRATLTKFAVLLLAACAAAQPKRADERQLTDAEKMGISGSRSMRNKLDDPESFPVSTARVVKDKDAKTDTTYYICVQGRAKNRMGGFRMLRFLELEDSR
jgi:hypothetical protein